MSKTALIVIDSSKRELFGCMLLGEYLSSLGIQPVFCNIFLLNYYYLRYMPAAVVFPNAGHNLGKFACNSKIFILPSESGSGQAEQIRDTYCGTSKYRVYSERIDRFFCWGNSMKKVLLESAKWCNEQLIVTGSPHTDHWLIPRAEAKPIEQRIGITTSFRALSNSVAPRKTNYFQWLDETEKSGGDGTYYLPPQHAESWLFFEASLARAIIGLVKEITSKRKEIVEIRPHPFERRSRYDYLKGISNGRLQVNKNGTISEWMKNKYILLTFISTSALDAAIQGVPVVSLKGLVDYDALKKIPPQFHYSYDDMFWQIDDYSQIDHYIDSAIKGKLSPCRDQKLFNEFITEHFYFPRDYTAAQLIALEIKKAIDSNKLKVNFKNNLDDGEDSRNIKQIIHKMIRYRLTRKIVQLLLIFPILNIIELIRYLYGLLPGKFDIGGSYLSFHIAELLRVRRSVNKVRKKIIKN